MKGVFGVGYLGSYDVDAVLSPASLVQHRSVAAGMLTTVVYLSSGNPDLCRSVLRTSCSFAEIVTASDSQFRQSHGNSRSGLCVRIEARLLRRCHTDITQTSPMRESGHQIDSRTLTGLTLCYMPVSHEGTKERRVGRQQHAVVVALKSHP